MIRSMTGFGSATRQVDGVTYAVEVRALNNKYFKSSIRLPEPIQAIEADLDRVLRGRIQRGSVTLTVKMKASAEDATHAINDKALLNYLGHLETIQAKVDQAGKNLSIDLTALLELPGVLVPAEDEECLVKKSQPVVRELVNECCDRLLQMREKEGEALSNDFKANMAVISDRTAMVAERKQIVIEEYHTRLRTRIDELMARAKLEISEHDLVREVAIFAERSDISEEVQRMTGHIDQFTEIIDAENTEPMGRTLDFVAQEMLREANTVASKSNDSTISRAVVEIKGSIDRIKEQVQNVE